MKPLLGIVLAGGHSRRMQVDKATLIHPRYANSSLTMLQHAIGRLQALVPDVAVSTQAPQWPANWQPPQLPLIADHSPDLGPAMAVFSCLQYAADHGFAAILVTPIDMPNLETEHLESLKLAWLADAASRSLDTSWPITSATFDGHYPQPLISIYPTSCLMEIEQVTQSPRRSLSSWLLARNASLVPLPTNAARNWNSPQD